MLAYILAIAIGLSSLVLFAIAFFASTVHRKDDFLWSGVGLFYALVLWLCASQIRGAVLLGQTAATILVLSFGWQTLQLRRAIAYPEQQGAMFSLMTWTQDRLSFLFKQKEVSPPTPTPEETTETATETSIESSTEAPTETATEAVTPEPATSSEEPITAETETSLTVSAEIEDKEAVEEIVAEEPSLAKNTPETPIKTPPTPTKPKKGFSWKNLLRWGKNKPSTKPDQINQALDEVETAKEDLDEDWEINEELTEVSNPVVAEIDEIEVNAELKETGTETAIIVESREEINEIVTSETESLSSLPLENSLQEQSQEENLSSSGEKPEENPSISPLNTTYESELAEENLIADDEVETIIEAGSADLSQFKSETIVTETSPADDLLP
jgi:hypothetical protein